MSICIRKLQWPEETFTAIRQFYCVNRVAFASFTYPFHIKMIISLSAHCRFVEKLTKCSKWLETFSFDKYRKLEYSHRSFLDLGYRMWNAITSPKLPSLSLHIHSWESLKYRPNLVNDLRILSKVAPTFYRLLHILCQCFLTSDPLCPLENTIIYRSLLAWYYSTLTEIIFVTWE